MPTTKQPIRLYVFYHDDVDAATQRIVPRNYLKDCITELTKISGRPFVIEYKAAIPGLTDMHYNGNPDLALSEWRKRVLHFAAENNLPRHSKTTRYLLIINGMLSETVAGVAYLKGSAVIGSLKTYRTIAHELGHSFGATHEEAELQRNPFGVTCETYVYPVRSGDRANCYRYSLENRQNIAGFLDAFD